MPDSERQRQLEELHSAALKRDASERDEFLRKACGGDAELRRAVESLLGYEPKLDGFLELPALESATLSGDASDQGRSLVGQELGPYAVLSVLGSGGMGEVYAARDTRLGRLVALKTLHPDVASDPERKRRLLLEAQAASTLNDPHIVALYDVGSADGIDFLVMEYVLGQTLDKLIPCGGLAIGKALEYAIAIADALARAHKAGIIHRDLKPGNVMVTEEGGVKVLDFGLAKLTEASPARAPEGSGSLVSTAGRIFGTAAYMSPEQAQGQPVDSRSDIFSFGVLLYEMLTGQRPFLGADRMLTLAAIVQREPTALTRVNPDLPTELEQIINRALKKDRDLRYPQATEMRTDLERLQRDIAPGKAGSAQFIRLSRKTVVAAGLLCLAVIAASFYYLRGRGNPTLTSKDAIVLAEFANATGDAVFDGTLRQGLSAQLEQSPFLNLLSDQSIAQTLVLMTQPKDVRLTRELAREVCRRTASAATIEGSISSLGSQYVLGLRAVNCHTGDVLAEEQVTANGKEHVITALGEASSKMRKRLGESLGSVEKYDAPPDSVTTGSLDALQAYSLGYQALNISSDPPAAILLFQRASSLDPNFAMAYAALGQGYYNLGETARAAGYTRKAYELRERVSERERFYITSRYEMDVTGNLEAVRKISELWAQTYPRDYAASGNLQVIYLLLGQYDKCLAAGQGRLKLNPGSGIAYRNLAIAYLFMNRLDEAKATVREAQTHNLDSHWNRLTLYQIHFLQNNTPGMESEAATLMRQPGYEDGILSVESNTAAYAGRFARARELTRLASEAAKRADAKESAASYQAEAALREALVGNMGMVKRQAQAGLALSNSKVVVAIAAIGLAMANGSIEASQMASDLAHRFPEDTIVQLEYLPMIRASIALASGRGAKNPGRAVAALAMSAPYELGGLVGVSNFVLCPAYLRGEAYLAAHEGGKAAAEFQKILVHPGVVQNFVVGALAHLGISQAYVLAGDNARARTGYQDFLALWKDADPDIPLLKQAKAEYAKLAELRP